MSPTGNLHYLDGLIHEQWARVAIGSDVSAPMPEEGGENAKLRLFDAGWVRVAPRESDTIGFEYSKKRFLPEEQTSRLVELAVGVGAKSLVRECNGKMYILWSRER